VFSEDPLLKVGVIVMTLALALTVVAVGVTISLRNEPERAVAVEEVATKSTVEPLVRGESPFEAWVEPRSKLDSPKAESKPEPPVEPQARVQPEPPPKPEPEPKPEPKAELASQPQRSTLPAAEEEWQEPTQQEIEAASRPRHYSLPPGAIMGLTVPALEIYNVPVFDSDAPLALAEGVGHVPETSLPWSPTPQRNVYIAGHRMGYSGTWSRMVFFHLGRLTEGDEVILKDRSGEAYRYRVSEVFTANPAESWVMGQLRGRDIVTLQTCTPIPTFEKRLIVRADRV
jgi:sortase A